MIFELREYDNILLKFSLQRAKLGEIVYHIEYMNDELKYLLPIGMTPDSE